jgi:hypothetical protein
MHHMSQLHDISLYKTVVAICTTCLNKKFFPFLHSQCMCRMRLLEQTVSTCEAVNVFTTYRVQTVQKYAVIRPVNYGWECNFVHSDDMLFNVFNVGGTEGSPGHRGSYIFSRLFTRRSYYTNMSVHKLYVVHSLWLIW